MSDLVAMLGLPLLACLLMGSILSYLGIHVLKREVIFIDIAIAQVAAVGALAAHLAFDVEDGSLISYLCSLACVLGMAGFYSVARHKVAEISIEAIIGISFAISKSSSVWWCSPLWGLSSGWCAGPFRPSRRTMRLLRPAV